jgi:hypothetical protein
MLHYAYGATMLITLDTRVVQYNTIQFNKIHDPKVSEHNLSTKRDAFL